jgi:hypothetical protein
VLPEIVKVRPKSVPKRADNFGRDSVSAYFFYEKVLRERAGGTASVVELGTETIDLDPNCVEPCRCGGVSEGLLNRLDAGGFEPEGLRRKSVGHHRLDGYDDGVDRVKRLDQGGVDVRDEVGKFASRRKCRRAEFLGEGVPADADCGHLSTPRDVIADVSPIARVRWRAALHLDGFDERPTGAFAEGKEAESS